ncbi:MAG: DUF4290 domain-containing protein [Bacteroidales bacterium]|jgi:hypothetical protein|nr:DUF4290 domain-containing protein [Bacteroidales bacterium]
MDRKKEFMEYNTEREKLIIPEYGRNIQKMVEYCLTIKDREKRNAYAKSIIVAMSQVNPVGKEIADYQQKLWDHLFIISDYKLDVDCPYQKPKREEKDEKPQPLKYKNSQITYRPYGSLIESMIKKATTMEEGEEKDYIVGLIAQQLKKSYLQWNINSCDDDMILEHFRILSGDKLHLSDDFKLKSTKDLLGTKNNNNNNKRQSNNNNNNKRNNNNSNNNNNNNAKRNNNNNNNYKKNVQK